MSGLGDAATVARHVATIFHDVSVYAPAEAKLIALAGEAGADVVAAVLTALDAGSAKDALLAAVKGVSDAASELEIHSELPP